MGNKVENQYQTVQMEGDFYGVYYGQAALNLASDFDVDLTAVQERRKKGRNYPTSIHLLLSPLPMLIILEAPDHFLFSLISVNEFSRIHTLTFILSSGTFALVTLNSWVGYAETL